MLVRFHSRAAAGVTLFGYVAHDLLRLMGMSGVVPGAVLAADVPRALSRLREALASPEGDRVPVPPAPPGGGTRGQQDDEPEREAQRIRLRTRAFPLLQLLDAAAAAQCEVVWEEADRATG